MSRVRSEGVLSAIPYRNWIVRNYGLASTYDQDYEPVVVYEGKRRAMVDEVIPQFYFRSRVLGEIFNNPMKRATLEINQRPICVTGVGYDWTQSGPKWLHHTAKVSPVGWALSTTMNDIIAVGNPTYGWGYSQVLMTNAVNRAWANMELSEVQLLASLGESGETLKFLLTLVRRGIQVIRDLLTGKWTKLVSDFGGLFSIPRSSEVWLELRYALRPLIFEILGVIKALQTQLVNTRFTSRGMENVSTVVQDVLNIGAYYYSDILWEVPVTRLFTDRTIFRAGVLTRITEDINGLMAIWGLDQPLEALWELTPFSFVLDWFFTIGDTIAAWSPQAGLQPLTSWCTITRTQEEEHLYGDFRYTNLTGYGFLSPPQYERCTPLYKARLVQQIRLVDPNRSTMPSWSVNLDWFKGVDLALIGRQALKGLL